MYIGALGALNGGYLKNLLVSLFTTHFTSTVFFYGVEKIANMKNHNLQLP